MKSSYFHWNSCTKHRLICNYTGQFFTNIILVKFDIQLDTISLMYGLNHHGKI